MSESNIAIGSLGQQQNGGKSTEIDRNKGDK